MYRFLPVAGVLALALAGTPPAWAQADVATVTVLHALPGFTADVYVNGQLTLDGFEPRTATDPLDLPAGEYHIEIRDVGAAADSTPVLEGTATVEAGQNLSIIAGLTESGEQALNVYANDQSAVKAGMTRLVVRHVAAAGSLDTRVDGESVLTDIANGAEATTQVAAGSHSVELAGGGSADALIGPMDLDLQEGTAQILYAIGSATEQSLDLMSQTISDLQTNPGGIGTGDGGLAARSDSPALPLAVVVTAGAALVMSTAWLVRNRRGRRSAG
jgi:hypothetical protein